MAENLTKISAFAALKFGFSQFQTEPRCSTSGGAQSAIWIWAIAVSLSKLISTLTTFPLPWLIRASWIERFYLWTEHYVSEPTHLADCYTLRAPAMGRFQPVSNRKKTTTLYRPIPPRNPTQPPPNTPTPHPQPPQPATPIQTATSFFPHHQPPPSRATTLQASRPDP